jgi:hypothetical protein
MMNVQQWWNENWQEKPKYSEKICPNASLSATNPIRSDLVSNLDRSGGKPATNRLSYGTAWGKIRKNIESEMLESRVSNLMLEFVV